MRIVNFQDTAFYPPRQPWDSLLYRLVEKHYEEFERVCPHRFQGRYGFWRPVIRGAILEYVDIDEPMRSRDGLPSRQQWSEAEWQFMLAL